MAFAFAAGRELDHFGQPERHLATRREQHHDPANTAYSAKPAVACRTSAATPIDERRCPDRGVRGNQISCGLTDRVGPRPLTPSALAPYCPQGPGVGRGGRGRPVRIKPFAPINSPSLAGRPKGRRLERRSRSERHERLCPAEHRPGRA